MVVRGLAIKFSSWPTEARGFGLGLVNKSEGFGGLGPQRVEGSGKYGKEEKMLISKSI